MKEIYMSVSSKVIREEELIERLLEQHPSAKMTLERLRIRFDGRSTHGAFAPIKNSGCGACNVTIASGRLQLARMGALINCSNCSRFLYIAAAD
jgi:predicted  nucleic acid-binding Zn-ribbon protein